MSDALAELARRAPGAGRLQAGDAATGRAEHPVCGDELELDVLVDDGLIKALAWRARGCPATLAVASALDGAWVGVPVDEAGVRLHRRLAGLGGLGAHEGHAEKIAMRALADALSRSAR